MNELSAMEVKVVFLISSLYFGGPNISCPCFHIMRLFFVYIFKLQVKLLIVNVVRVVFEMKIYIYQYPSLKLHID